MTQPATPREVFLELVHGVANNRGAELAELYAEQTHVVHPFDPSRGAPLRTRDELRVHFAGTPTDSGETTREPVDIVVHETTDPEVIVAEFSYAGTTRDTGETVAVPAVFVLRVRDGKIVESRDYFDHLAAACARGTLDELLNTLSAPRG
jgi:uncharacterized protein